MSFKDFYEREKYVALNGQSRNFRIVKYIVLFIVSSVLYVWKGLSAVGYFLLIGGISGIVMHFFFRWKTGGWTKSWGLYKKIPLNNNE